MSKLTSTFVLVVAGLAGCATQGGGDDTGDDGGDFPGFTNGVSTLSGHSEAGYVDGKRGEARFANPVNVAYGPDGMVYVADFDNGKIRVVDAESGATSTTISKEGFKRPFGMAFASDGTLYVTTDDDPMGGHSPMTGTIWRIDVDSREAMPIAQGIGRPRGIAVLPTGQLAISDYQHHVIQIVNPASGAVSPLAGTWDAKGMVDGVGGAARFASPYGLAVVDGKLVVADFENHRLREIGLDGSVRTIAGAGTAGFADGAMGTAQFNRPQGLAVAENGDLYVSDTENFRIRVIRGDSVETIAGDGQPGYIDSDDRLASQLYGLEGVSVRPDGGMVFVADGGRGENVPYNRVRSIKLD